ncbi:hypothetical protein FRC17_004946, partial [Serendipita sp. 399]
MAEALTIASLISLCTSLGTRLNEIVNRYQTANQTITSIVEQCTMLHIALKNVQNMGTSGQTERLKDGTALQRGLDCALIGCHVTLQTISSDIKRLEVTSDAPENTSWRVNLGYSTKFAFVWKEGNMKTCLEQLRVQYNAILVLLHAYSLQSAEQMRESILSIRDTLSRIQNDADSTRHRRLSKRSRMSQDVGVTMMTETGIDISFTASIFNIQEQKPDVAVPLPVIDEEVAPSYTSQISHHQPSNDQPSTSQPSESQYSNDQPLDSQHLGIQPPNDQPSTRHLSITRRSSSHHSSSHHSSRKHSSNQPSSSQPPNNRLPSDQQPSNQPFHTQPASNDPTPPQDGIDVVDDDDDIPNPAALNLFSRTSQKITLTQRNLAELSANSQLSTDATLEILQQIQEIAGTDGQEIMQVILQRKHCNVNSVLGLLKQLRDIGSSKHFYYELLSLQNLDYNLKHTVNSLTRLRSLGSLDDYTDCLAFLRRNNYDVLKTQTELENLKRTCSTPEDFHFTLHYLRALEYTIASTTKNLEELRKRWTGNAQEYSCVLGLLDHNVYELEVTIQQLGQLMPFLKRKIGLISRNTDENVPLRRSAILQLLRKNKYELDQTITEIHYLCEKGGYPNAPVAPLRLLESADHDFAKTTNLFKWLRELPLEDDDVLKVLQENDYRLDDLQVSILDYQTRLYGKSGNSQLLGTFRFNRFNAQRFIRQHQWALELLASAPELQILFPSFLSKGWHIERLGRMLGSACSERIQNLLVIGENEEEVIDRWLSEMDTMLQGVGPTGLAIADRLIKEASFDLRVVEEFGILRKAAQDNWGMLLMLSFVDKDPDHDTKRAVRAYKPLGKILHTHKSEFWGFILDLFRNRRLSALDYSRLLLNIWEAVTFHLHDRMKEAEITFENVLYSVGAYDWNLPVLLQDLQA